MDKCLNINDKDIQGDRLALYLFAIILYYGLRILDEYQFIWFTLKLSRNREHLAENIRDIDFGDDLVAAFLYQLFFFLNRVILKSCRQKRQSRRQI